MRIGIVLPKASAYSETFFKNKINGLVSNGHSVILYVNTMSDNYVSESVLVKVAPKLSGVFLKVFLKSLYLFLRTILLHPKRSWNLFKLNRINGAGFIQSLKNLISSSHILGDSLDWLHYGFGTMVINNEYLAKAMGAKMAISFRGFDIALYPLKHPGCYLKAWSVVDKVHVISDDIKQLVYKNGFNDEAPIVKITPAIDTSFFSKEKINTSLKKPIRILTVARLHWKKGLEYTLESLSLLKKMGIDFIYILVGEGEEYERLKFAAHQLGISSDVEFTGKISPIEIKNTLANSDIYLQYSLQEGFCNSVLEAQAMGLLCVVSDAEGLSENIEHKETGWVVPARQSGLLSDTLLKIINLPAEEQLAVRNNAVRRVKSKFNLIDQNKSFLKFYGIE